MCGASEHLLQSTEGNKISILTHDNSIRGSAHQHTPPSRLCALGQVPEPATQLPHLQNGITTTLSTQRSIKITCGYYCNVLII